MQHEWVGIGSEFGDDEGHTLRHQAGNEGHVAREPVELGHQDRTLRLARCGQRCGELRPSVERVGALAGFDLGEFGEDGDAFGFGKARDRCSLASSPSPDRPCRWVETR